MIQATHADSVLRRSTLISHTLSSLNKRGYSGNGIPMKEIVGEPYRGIEKG